MKISVVIPTYNRSALLYRTLYTLKIQNDPDYEALVSVDDDEDKRPESEAIVAMFASTGMPVRSFYTGQFKRGQGWSVETYPYNVGIRQAQGELVLLNSGDVMSVTDTLAQHRQAQQYGNNLAVFSTVHALNAETQANIDSYPWKANPRTLLFSGSCDALYCGYGACYDGRYVTAEARVPYHFQMSIRKSWLEHLRGFDEDYYGRMGCGDDDLASRFKRIGLKFQWSPHILAIHQNHDKPESANNKQEVLTNVGAGSGQLLYQEKNKQGVVRNLAHEWGQYPRDMAALASPGEPV